VEVIPYEFSEILAKDGLGWNQELAYPKRFEPFGYVETVSAMRLTGTQGWLI
jgi:hypothetical protein